MGAASTSIRAFCPLTRCVIVGDTFCPPIAAMPPSIVVFCTIVTSAWTTAEHTITTRSVPNQRFMKASWAEAEGRASLAAASVMTSAAELGDVARLLAGIAAVFPEGAVGRDGAGASRMCAFLFHVVLLRLTSPYCTPR